MDEIGSKAKVRELQNRAEDVICAHHLWAAVFERVEEPILSCVREAVE